jgi:hypothetical protein
VKVPPRSIQKSQAPAGALFEDGRLLFTFD